MGITHFSTLDEPVPAVLRSVLEESFPSVSTASPEASRDVMSSLPSTKTITWASVVRGQRPLTSKD